MARDGESNEGADRREPFVGLEEDIGFVDGLETEDETRYGSYL